MDHQLEQMRDMDIRISSFLDGRVTDVVCAAWSEKRYPSRRTNGNTAVWWIEHDGNRLLLGIFTTYEDALAYERIWSKMNPFKKEQWRSVISPN